MKKYRNQFKLKKGLMVKIDGLPFEYMGNGMVGSNTMFQKTSTRKPSQVDWAQAFKASKDAEMVSKAKEVKELINRLYSLINSKV